MLVDKAIIYEGVGANPQTDRFMLEGPAGKIIVVAAGDVAQAPALARELADRGARLIELCGGISPAWRPKVAAAVGSAARVSSVTFGIESLQAAAAYNAAFLEGKPPREAFIILNAGADPHGDRFIKAFPPQETTFVPVPDEVTGAKVAAQLAKSGYGLIELYGGFSTAGAAAVIEAVDGLAPVGVGSFAVDVLDRAPGVGWMHLKIDSLGTE